MRNDIIQNSVNINYLEDEYITVEDNVKSIGVKIEAARSGRVNGNLVMYTPKAMTQGVESFLTPFNKHLQSKHNGEAVGVIREAEHVLEMFPDASDEFLDIVQRVKEHSENSNGKELVKAVKELINTEEYKSPHYRGLGITTICGDVYDPSTISKLRTKQDGIGTVSIGGKSKEVYCSVCAERYTKEHAKVHKKGNYYDGELCFHINNDLYLDHCGFVTNPADKLTGTEVVQDDQSEFLNVGITHYNVQDSAEKPMTLEELKQKAKDSTAVKELIKGYFTDEAAAEVACKEYEAGLKNSRATHHLLSEGNVLNLRTPVGVYVAEKLLEEFKDGDEDKEYLSEILTKAKKTLNIESLDTALQEFLDSKMPKEPEDEKNKEADAAADKKEETPTVVEDSQEGLYEKLTSYLDAKFEELSAQTHKVQDSQEAEQKSLLHQELKTLRLNSEADEAVINALQTDLSNSLIDQIVSLKGGASEEYVTKLKARSLDQLKLTLEDLKEISQAKAEATEVDPELKKVTQTEVITQVEDSQDKDLDKQEEALEVQDEAPAEDKEAEVKVEDSKEETFPELVAKFGLAKAMKMTKGKR